MSILQIGEQCDDGNSYDLDGCSNLCQENYCGDEVINDGEECGGGYIEHSGAMLPSGSKPNTNK